jgi:hypothetical protein
MTLANTIATTSLRNKFRMQNLDKLLRANLVAEKICNVDRTDAYTIQSPYGSQPTTVISALTGTYATAAYTVTLSTLTVNSEFKIGEQVYGFENIVNNFDLFADRVDEQQASIKTAIDKHVLNTIGTNGTGSYTTPTGGFTTSANLPVIVANLLSKVAGYESDYNGTYLVVENTDLVGIIPAMAAAGFSYSDEVLNNGFKGKYMGVEIYAVPSGTFATATSGGESVTMSGCRLFGVKNMCTYAAPRGVEMDEFKIEGSTGMHIRTYGLIGAKVWAAKAGLTVKITLA